MKFIKTAINFIEHYRSLFLNPTENAAEIIITTALIIIGAVIFWVFGSILVNQLRTVGRRLRSERNLWMILLLYFGAALILGAMVFAVALPVSSNSSFCGRVCHSMNPQFQGWRRSSHSQVPCSSCHTDDSLKALVYDKAVVGTREIVHEISGDFAKPINANSRYSQKKVPNERCLSCHSPKTRFFSVRLGLNMDHPKHLKAGLRCTTCHNRVAHPNSEKYGPLKDKNKGFKYKDYLTMRQGCWRCHKRGGRYIDVAGSAHKGPFVGKGGQKAPTDCKTCHDRDWKDMPKLHRPEAGVKWGRGLAHGEVARQNFGQCRGCHEPTVWCSTRCHFGITMPHVKNWVQIHPTLAKRDIKRCFSCHKAQESLDFCGKRCHHDPFKKQFNLPKDKNWADGKEQHGVVVKAAGGAPCFRCHEQKTWCTTQCHQGITMPHVAGWRGIHFKSVEFAPGVGWQREKAACVMCHNKDGKDPNYCFLCHHKQFGRYSPIGLMGYVRRESKVGYDLITNGQRLVCQNCHAHPDMAFCRDCHEGRPDRDIRQGQE